MKLTGLQMIELRKWSVEQALTVWPSRSITERMGLADLLVRHVLRDGEAPGDLSVEAPKPPRLTSGARRRVSVS